MDNKNTDSSNEKESPSTFKEQISSLRNFWKEKEQTYSNNSGSLGSITSPNMQRKISSPSKNDKPQNENKSSNTNKDHTNSSSTTSQSTSSQPVNRSQKLEEFKEQLQQQKKVCYDWTYSKM